MSKKTDYVVAGEDPGIEVREGAEAGHRDDRRGRAAGAARGRVEARRPRWARPGRARRRGRRRRPRARRASRPGPRRAGAPWCAGRRPPAAPRARARPRSRGSRPRPARPPRRALRARAPARGRSAPRAAPARAPPPATARRGRRASAQAGYGTPALTSVRPSFPSVAPTRKSPHSARIMPPAIACPVTPHTSGAGKPYQPKKRRLIPSTIARWSSSLSVGTSFRSTPAEKNRGRPTIATAAGGSAASSAWTAAPSSSSATFIAFAGGRSIRTTTMSPSRSTLRNSATGRRLRLSERRRGPAPSGPEGRARGSCRRRSSGTRTRTCALSGSGSSRTAR